MVVVVVVVVVVVAVVAVVSQNAYVFFNVTIEPVDYGLIWMRMCQEPVIRPKYMHCLDATTYSTTTM